MPGGWNGRGSASIMEGRTVAMGVSASAKKAANYSDLLALPENVVGEIVGGELVVSPRPTFGHARVASMLGGELTGPFDRGRGGPGGWWILDEVELHFGADVLVPDLAGWRRSRMPKPPAPAEPFVTLAPDWLCEVLSPSTARMDFSRKLPIYAREKVAHAWVINPVFKTLEVFRLQDGAWLLAGAYSGDDKVRAEPFDALE